MNGLNWELFCRMLIVVVGGGERSRKPTKEKKQSQKENEGLGDHSSSVVNTLSHRKQTNLTAHPDAF